LSATRKIGAVVGAVAAILIAAALFWAPRIDANPALVAAGETRAIVRLTAGALEQYRRDKSAYPSSLEQLVAAGYLRQMPSDASGKPLQYRHPSQRQNLPFEVWSEIGGSIIGNWQ